VEKGFYFRSPALRDYFNKKKRGLLGCNFSIHKDDLLEINGFDERYEAPSIGEDSDIQYRLELNGVGIKSLNNIAVQYHLYHKLQERPAENLELFNKVKESGEAFTPFGIKKEISK
jgi:GT2 family glycosyltransferase